MHVYKQLTHINSCAIAKLPMAHAKSKGVRTSRGLTVAFVTSEFPFANIKIIDFISDLKGNKIMYKTCNKVQ